MILILTSSFQLNMIYLVQPTKQTPNWACFSWFIEPIYSCMYWACLYPTWLVYVSQAPLRSKLNRLLGTWFISVLPMPDTTAREISAFWAQVTATWLAYSLVWKVMAENIVHWFIVKEKHCWLAKKIRLIRQANGSTYGLNKSRASSTTRTATWPKSEAIHLHYGIMVIKEFAYNQSYLELYFLHAQYEHPIWASSMVGLSNPQDWWSHYWHLFVVGKGSIELL